MDSSTPQLAQAAQLDLFSRGLPRKPYATDELGTRLLITSRRRALTRRYLQVNPPHLRVLTVYDVDRAGAVLAWEDAGLPAPLFSSGNPENGHAHLAWALEAPVLVQPEARTGPLRFLCAVESLMRSQLEADDGFAGLISKNPLHPHWRTLWGPPYAFSLAELGEWLPGLERHLPRRRPERVGRWPKRRCVRVVAAPGVPRDSLVVGASASARRFRGVADAPLRPGPTVHGERASDPARLPRIPSHREVRCAVGLDAVQRGGLLGPPGRGGG